MQDKDTEEIIHRDFLTWWKTCDKNYPEYIEVFRAGFNAGKNYRKDEQ